MAFDPDETTVAEVNSFLADGSQHRLRRANEVSAEAAPDRRLAIAWPYGNDEAIPEPRRKLATVKTDAEGKTPATILDRAILTVQLSTEGSGLAWTYNLALAAKTSIFGPGY